MLKKHEHRDVLYRQIVENSEEGIWVINDKSETTFVNEKMASMLGYSREEMLGKDMFYFMTQENVEIAKNNMNRRKTGVKENHDFIFQTKAGRKVWTSIAASPINDQNRNFIGALGMVNDISERRKSETLLLAQRRIFELLVMDAPLESALVELTNALEYLLDDVKASILLLDEDGLRLWTGAAPNLPKAYSEAINGVPIGSKTGSCGTSAFEKKLIIVSDIKTDPLWEDYKNLADLYNLRSCWSSPIFSRDNKVLGTFAVYSDKVRSPNEFELQLIKDATAASALSIEHKRAQQNLKISRDNATFHSEARKSLALTLDYEKILNDIPQLIVSHYADWCFLCHLDQDGELHTTAFASDTSKTHLIKQLENYRPDMDAPEGLPRAIRNSEAVLYANVNEEQLKPGPSGWPIIGTRNPEVLRIMTQLGLKSYMAIPIIVRGKTVGGFLIASSSIKKHYNQFDLQLAVELAHSCAIAIDNSILYRESQQAIAARDVFISVASHEFRTPLTILRGRIDLLSMILEKNSIPQALSEKLSSTLHGLITQSERISKLVDTLLDVSRIGTGRLFLNKEDINLSELIAETIGRMKPEFEAKKCSLEVNIQKDIHGKWDSLRIEQVITNLLSNALKFGQDRPVEINVVADAAKVYIRVRDHGLGIPVQDQQRIFACFERAASEKHYSGLGLGLYITKQIVVAHDGTIQVESVEGNGACFLVELPLID